MSHVVQRTQHFQTTSNGATGVAGPPFYVGGNRVGVQFTGPDALNGLEGSNDKLNWVTLDDVEGNPISSIGLAMLQVQQRPRWIRPTVALDASGPREFPAIVTVEKETGH